MREVLKFYKHGNGRSLETLELIPNVKNKVAKAEGIWILGNVWNSEEERTFQDEDIQIIAKVCNEDYKISECASRGKFEHICYGCITRSLSEKACKVCEETDCYANLPFGFLQRQDVDILKDIKRLKKYVIEDNSMYFI